MLGHEAVDGDAVGPELARQGVRQAEHGALRRDVVERAGHAAVEHHRADVDHARIAGPAQQRQRRLRDQERRPRVQREDAIPLLRGQRLDRPRRVDAGVVDEHAQPALAGELADLGQQRRDQLGRGRGRRRRPPRGRPRPRSRPRLRPPRPRPSRSARPPRRRPGPARGRRSARSPAIRRSRARCARRDRRAIRACAPSDPLTARAKIAPPPQRKETLWRTLRTRSASCRRRRTSGT